MLSGIVHDVLTDLRVAGHVADWLEDHCSDKPEVGTYVRRFRKESKIRINDAIDVIAKFGLPIERRLAQKFRRLLKKCRYKHGYVPNAALEYVTETDFKSRVKLNTILKETKNGAITGFDCLQQHKKKLRMRLSDVETMSMIGSSLVLSLRDMLGAQTLQRVSQ